MLLNVIMGSVVVVLLLSGNIGLGLIAMLAFAVVALRVGRKETRPPKGAGQ